MFPFRVQIEKIPTALIEVKVNKITSFPMLFQFFLAFLTAALNDLWSVKSYETRSVERCGTMTKLRVEKETMGKISWLFTNSWASANLQFRTGKFFYRYNFSFRYTKDFGCCLKFQFVEITEFLHLGTSHC